MDYIKCFSVLVLCLVYLSARVNSDGNFVLYVKFVSYQTDGKLSNGHCCDNWPWCSSSACDFKFKICLDSGPARGNMRIDSNACNYGFYQTNIVERDRNALDFGANMGGVTNPIRMDIAGPVSGRFVMDVEVKDHDGLSGNDHVDFFSAELVATKDVETTHQISSRTDLTVTTLIRCAQNWYGNRCDELCPPAPEDNYECDPATGHKTCKLGWRGQMCEERYKIHEDEVQ